MEVYMQARFYSEFSKRHNSTKNPEDSSSTSVYVDKTITLKGECSYLRPSFFVADVTGFVYCKVWNKFYFIKNVSYDINGAQYIDCEIDVLGTWRNDIFNHSAFVAYSSSNYNVLLADKRILTEASLTQTINVNTPFFTSTKVGTYLVTVFNEIYGNCTYAMTQLEYRAFINKFIKDGDKIFGAIAQYFGSATESIISVRMVPIAKVRLEGDDDMPVYLGSYDMEMDAKLLSTNTWEDGDGISLNGIPNDFTMLEPYTTVSAFFPLIGTIDLPSAELIGASSISFKYVADLITGKLSLTLARNGIVGGSSESNDIHVIGTFGGTIGVDIPISISQLQNPMGVVNGSLGVFSSAVALGAFYAGGGEAIALGAAAYSGLIKSGIQDMASVIDKKATTIGSFGGVMGILGGYKARIQINRYGISEQPANLTELYGRPCAKVLRIGDLTGYCETVGFSINISELDDVKTMINRLMDKGVYLE